MGQPKLIYKSQISDVLISDINILKAVKLIEINHTLLTVFNTTEILISEIFKSEIRD